MPLAQRRLRRSAPSRRRRSFRLEKLEPRSLLSADPYISEFLAVNDGGLLDEDGDASDWIEIHNRGDSPADLTGWSLTDDAEVLTQWVFPSTIIPADGRLVVFASGKDRAEVGGQLHTSFRLAGDGEYLALVAADTTTVVSDFAPNFPRQRTNVSYGQTPIETIASLVGPQAAATYVVPTATLDAQIGQSWSGGSEPFDDSTWSDATGGIGFDVATAAATIPGQVAYKIAAGTPGNQATSGSLGMDFVVTRPITVHSLGAFDDSSNGLGRTITVQLWSRDDRGTSNNFTDDIGGAILATATFTPASPGTLVGGSRFKTLATSVELQPGAYTIVANGYGVGERNGVAATGGVFGTVEQTSAIQFVGQSRYAGGASTAFPTNVDLGPANRYGAGTFAFDDPQFVAPPTPPPPDAHVAYITAPGVGTHTFAGNLGMDFQVDRPIRVTELGVFDSGQDGIKGAVGVSLWSRNVNNTQTQLASIDFSAGEGRLEPGTGSRFVALPTPIILQPGVYTINALGFVGQDRYGQAQDANPLNGTTDGANGAVRFIGTSRFATDPNRFIFEAFHRYPNRVDSGPFNKWAAGTFKYDMPLDLLYEVDVGEAMANVNSSAYVRLPFTAEDPSQFDALRLRMSYDDGFVAYLNGVEIARRSAPTPLAWNSTSTAQRLNAEVFSPETINVSAFLSVLQTGENVLAIHALNAFATNTDFAVRAELDAVSSGDLETRFFTTPTPGELNNQGVVGIVEDTQFSVDRGIIVKTDRDENGMIHVAITTPTEAATIYYTTDGTAPTPSNGALYAGPIAIGNTTTLRAAAFKEGFLSTDVDTQTYLFLEDVAYQTNTPTGYPPHWNGEPADYGMTQNPADRATIANDPAATDFEYEEVIVNALSSLPTISIVLDPEDMFGPANGIYTNLYPRGDDWERAASIEYILPDGSEGFQTNAALQMMGWTSRIPGVSPKHTMRVVFKDEFGPGRLNYPFFPNLDVNSFNSIALRANSRDSWVGDNGGIQNANGRESRPVASYIRDEWMRATEAAMGEESVSGSFAHVYINGQYWGLYNTTERPDAAFAEEHLGGVEENYDVLRFCNPSPQLVDGNMDAWNTIVASLEDKDAYQRIQGNNPDGTRNPAYEVLVDVDSLIDFMIGGYYHGAADWPCNWYAIRDRSDPNTGFKFLQWDGDIAFPFADLTWSTVTAEAFWNSSPGRIDVALRDNPEYRLRFADAVQKHFFNDGALTPENAAARWDAIGQSIRPALAAEAARWGDYRRDVDPTFGGSTLYTTETYWDPQNQFMLDTFFPFRAGIVLDQLQTASLFPVVEGPQFSQHGGEVPSGIDLGISAPAGTVYYTTDGTDPRSPSVVTTLVPENAAKRVLVPSTANGGNLLGDAWHGGAEPFNDAAWRSGARGVGYEAAAGLGYQPYIGIDVLSAMYGITGSVFVRIPFDVSSAELDDLNSLTLLMRHDDGFVAFLNGVEIASINAPAVLTYNAQATAGTDDALIVQRRGFDVSQFLPLLHAGTNVLAIHGLNAGATSSDMLISAVLDAATSDRGEASPTAQIYTGEFPLSASGTVIARAFDGNIWSAKTAALFSVSNPLRVTELMYNPPGGAETTEFIELTNTGPSPVSLPGVRFARADGMGVEYEFLDTDAITQLLPGERIVIGNDLAAFAAAYPDLVGVLIAERPFVGNLSNGGELLTLLDAEGGIIQQFTYDDAWQPTTDGDGFSLVIVNELAAKSTWNDAAAWRASFDVGGSPGTADVLPADVNGDQQVNAADVLLVQAAMSAPAGASGRADVNRDGHVTEADVEIVSQHLGLSFLPPSPVNQPHSASHATLPTPIGVVPSYTPPPPTHGFSWQVDEWISSLPDLQNELDLIPIGGVAPPTAAAPAVVVGASGASTSGTSVLLAPPSAQASALIDQVIGTSVVRSARIRTTDEPAATRPRLLARRAAASDGASTARYLSLISNSASALNFSLGVTSRRSRGPRTSSSAAAHEAALASILSADGNSNE